jgi:serine/threonine-protein kinase
VLAGKPATEASDVYALGALGRRWLTGSPAYAEEAALGRYLRDRLTTDAIPVDDCTTGIPDGLADLIDAMMARNADDRPSSVAEVVRIVEDLASQPPDGSMDAAGRPVARRWRLGRRNS